MAAPVGDLWKAIYEDRADYARIPPLSLAQSPRRQQQSITETFASLLDEIFGGFHFPYIEDVVNLPAFNRYADEKQDDQGYGLSMTGKGS